MSTTAETLGDGHVPVDRPALHRMRQRMQRRALLVGLGVLASACFITFVVASYASDPRLTATHIEVRLAGVRVMNVPYREIAQIRVRSGASLIFSTNPLRTVRVGGCIRDDVVQLERRQRWLANVIVCPRDPDGFVREVERLRGSDRDQPPNDR